jgi:hypothetical protein
MFHHHSPSIFIRSISRFTKTSIKPIFNDNDLKFLAKVNVSLSERDVLFASNAQSTYEKLRKIIINHNPPFSENTLRIANFVLYREMENYKTNLKRITMFRILLASRKTSMLREENVTEKEKLVFGALYNMFLLHFPNKKLPKH